MVQKIDNPAAPHFVGGQFHDGSVSPALKRNRHFSDRSRRTIRHHYNAIRQVDRFINVMRYDDNRLLRFLQDVLCLSEGVCRDVQVRRNLLRHVVAC